jgi:hypothetical protein
LLGAGAIIEIMHDDVLGHLREARAILNDETKEGKGSREVALVITKIDEALLWRQEVLRLRQPIKNHTNDK